MRLAEHVAYKGEREVYTVFWWRSLGEKIFGRTSCRWENNIRMDFKEVG